ncbi:hypothetical protein [Paraburkholderia tropica]|uniref:hypothetical protein n=1 Tax=Paraburkholderia tropica TaxID=92647 RepID=UPI00115FAB53|nr:hypothetical protein [Paraburkholderia tropica]
MLYLKHALGGIGRSVSSTARIAFAQAGGALAQGGALRRHVPAARRLGRGRADAVGRPSSRTQRRCFKACFKGRRSQREKRGRTGFGDRPSALRGRLP